jgi:hypothetical protein
MSLRHYKDKQKCTETLQRQTQMYRDITKTNKNVQRHYNYKQMSRDITKTNKNVQRHYKYKHKLVETLQRQTKCTETLQRQTKMYRDITKTKKILSL